jgi:hypothetical protein
MPILIRQTRSQKPRNRGGVLVARSSIDAVTPLMQEQTNNAMAVNGYPVLFFARKKTGVLCSCNQLQPTPSAPGANQPPTTPGVHVLDPEGHGTQEYIASMLEGASVRIGRYGERHNTFDVDSQNPQRAEPHGPRIRSLEKTVETKDIDDPFADELEPFDESELFETTGMSIGSSNPTGCGVCLGTGFVGGYTLVNGHRAVYDCQYHWASATGFILHAEERPIRYSYAGGNAEAEIDVLLPKGAVSVDVIRLWSNKEAIASGIRFLLWSGEDWVEVGANLLDYCDGQMHRLRIVFDLIPTDFFFTHLELQFNLGSVPMYAEFGKLVESENLDLPENVDSMNVIISPLIPKVHLYDIILETTYGRAWKLTNVQNFVDRNKNPYGWETTARLIQKFELAANLTMRPLVQRRDKHALLHALQPGESTYTPYPDYKQTEDR